METWHRSGDNVLLFRVPNPSPWSSCHPLSSTLLPLLITAHHNFLYFHSKPLFSFQLFAPMVMLPAYWSSITRIYVWSSIVQMVFSHATCYQLNVWSAFCCVHSGTLFTKIIKNSLMHWIYHQLKVPGNNSHFDGTDLGSKMMLMSEKKRIPGTQRFYKVYHHVAFTLML